MTKHPPPVTIRLAHADIIWLATWIAFLLWLLQRLDERAKTNTPHQDVLRYDLPANYLERGGYTSRRLFNEGMALSSANIESDFHNPEKFAAWKERQKVLHE